MKITNKDSRRRKIRYQIRRVVKGTPSRLRLSVFRSNKYIYCQLIDDLSGKTLYTASSKEPACAGKGSKSEQAKMVGKMIGERAVKGGCSQVVFDRGGYLYHGRVKNLADGAREAGLQF